MIQVDHWLKAVPDQHRAYLLSMLSEGMEHDESQLIGYDASERESCRWLAESVIGYFRKYGKSDDRGGVYEQACGLLHEYEESKQ